MSAEKQRRVFRVAWDGEPSMSGAPHVQSIGTEFESLKNAQMGRNLIRDRANRPNLRIESRLVTEWQEEQ